MVPGTIVRGARSIITAGMLLLGGPVHGQTPVKADPLRPVTSLPTDMPAAAPGSHVLTADDLAAYLDGIVPQQLKRENIAGAVVLVVKDGNVFFQKGYGYADVEKKTPMLVDQTLVRPGSTSKLFTWTAVMQMVEQGKIDLDRDVNEYIDFKIPATYSKPITMRNLMTHTAGFEEAVKDLFVGPKRQPMTLGGYLRNHVPQRVYAPGTTPAYSNYGAALAGYIVERVSGVPFDDYVEQHIFQPLAMQHTTFRQPIPAPWQPLMSSGYALATDKAKPYELAGVSPYGSATSSAADMSHFMLAQLQGGQWNNVRILKPETVELMHSRQFAVNPALSHMALGFYEETRNGHRILGHAGDTQYFHSDLHLIQDANLGFFVSYNSAGRREVSPRTVLLQAFLDRYFPYKIPAAPSQADAAGDARLVAGEYISSRRAVTDVLSYFWMLSNLKVIPGKDGTIVTDGLKSEDQVPKTWEEIGPLLYREKNGQDRIGFTKDSEGRMVLSVDFPFEVSTRVSLADSKNLNLFLIGFTSVVSFLALALWPLTGWMRRHYHQPLPFDRQRKRLRAAIRVVALIDLVYIASWFALLGGGEPLFDGSLDPTLRLMQLVGWLGTLGTIVILYAVAKTWRAPSEWGLSHAGNVLIALSALSFSWFLLHWHLLHFSILY